MPEVRRFTTKYVPAEDRIQLLMELEGGEVQVLWLTRRLLNRLLPQLLRRLEGTSQAVRAAGSAPSAAAPEVVQRFSQEAAVRSMAPQPPVQPRSEGPAPPAAVVTEVDVRTGRAAGGTAAVLAFRSGETALPELPFDERMLRQWLGVVHAQYRAGGWREGFWPAWMEPLPAAAGRLN